MKENIKFDIKFSAILKVFLAIFLVWLVITLKSIIVLFFIAFILATAIRPLVKKLQSFKFPKGAAVGLIYVILIVVIASLIYLIAKPLAKELLDLSTKIPDIFNNLQNTFPALSGIDFQSYLSGFSSNLKSSGENLGGSLGTAVSAVTGIFDIFTSLFTIFIVSLYLTLGLDELVSNVVKFVPKENREKVMKNYLKVEEQVGAWLRGQIFLMVLIGLTTYISMKILGIPFTLPLAIFAGLMEILPIVGPLVYSVVIILVALTVSPTTAVLAAIACLIIQQLEGHLIVPMTMKKAVGLSPVTTIFAILSGAALMGIVGALLAVPVAAVFSAILHDLYAKD